MGAPQLVAASLLSTTLLRGVMDTEQNPQSPPTDTTDPLWLRTKRRLDRMATFTAQRTPMWLGSDELIALREERVALASRELVLRLKALEDRTVRPEPQGPAGNSLV